jgi:ParB-like chromosome segregation protein Spo0J
MAEQTRIQVKVVEVDLHELVLLDSAENARFMTHEQFDGLVRNIKRDGCMTTMPFCWKNDAGAWEVLSGNHRVQAAIAAGLTKAPVLVTEDRLSKDRRRAIQLSHNAITGQDDPALLARLYSEIGDVDLRGYTGLDDDVLGLLPELEVPSISEMNLDTRVLQFVFMPHEVDDVLAQLDAAMDVAPHADETLIGDRKEYERLLGAIEEVEKRADVRNRASALRLILAVFERHKDEIKKGDSAK